MAGKFCLGRIHFDSLAFYPDLPGFPAEKQKLGKHKAEIAEHGPRREERKGGVLKIFSDVLSRVLLWSVVFLGHFRQKQAT
jgi:hypothetical protein